MTQRKNIACSLEIMATSFNEVCTHHPPARVYLEHKLLKMACVARGIILSVNESKHTNERVHNKRKTMS